MRRSLLAAVMLVAVACGDAGTTTASSTETAPTTSTVATPATTATPPTSTPAETSTSAPAATLAPPATSAAADDPFGVEGVSDCAGLVGAALVMLQAVFDELGDATVDDLNAAGGQLPGLALLEREGQRFDDRTVELGCDADELEQALFGRLGELEPRGELAQSLLSGFDEELEDPEPPEAPEGVETFEVADRSHTEDPVAYPQDPPAGGPHHPVWQNCGFYAEPVGDEHAVHSLEHGVVWITYDAARTQAEELEVLRALAAEPEVIVSPYQGLGDTPVVASAWGAQLRLGSAIDARLPQFVDAYRDGAAAPEPAASCVGGVGEPE